jgi:hypothetical protein
VAARLPWRNWAAVVRGNSRQRNVVGWRLGWPKFSVSGGRSNRHPLPGKLRLKIWTLRLTFLSVSVNERETGQPVTFETLVGCAFNGSLGETIKQVALLILFTIYLAHKIGTLGNFPAQIMS